MDNNENQEVNNQENDVEEQEVVTTTEYIDYTENFNEIRSDIQAINGNITFIVLLLIFWCVLSNFIFRKGWTR